MIRAFLSSEKGQIDFPRWFGKNEGLTKATNIYLETIGARKPYTPESLQKVRRQLRAAVTQDELIALGWKAASTKSPRGKGAKACNIFLSKRP